MVWLITILKYKKDLLKGYNIEKKMKEVQRPFSSCSAPRAITTMNLLLQRYILNAQGKVLWPHKIIF